MSRRRRELKTLIHHLKVYLAHQQAIGAAGVVAASSEAREAFEESLTTRRKREIATLQDALRGPSRDAAAHRQHVAPQRPAASQSAHKAPPSRPSPVPNKPDFLTKDKQDRAPTPAPAIDAGEHKPLWKQLGARPQKTILERPASTKQSPAPEQKPPPPRPPSEPVRRSDPAFEEVRRKDSRPPSKRPQPTPRGPSLFGEEWDKQNRPKLPPIRGFDSSPDQTKRLEQMTSGQKLEFLRECLGDCTRCKLSQERTNIVFGEGDPNADIVFVGEGPGYYEDKQGVPFVGKAGQLLDRMIVAMGIERADVYIANVVKCRPPNNRDPQVDEIAQCAPFLYKQLETIDPKVIITLGRFASQCLLDTSSPMGRMRGSWQTWRDIDVMPTYHPAYLLRNSSGKRDAWSDLQLVMERLGLGK